MVSKDILNVGYGLNISNKEIVINFVKLFIDLS